MSTLDPSTFDFLQPTPSQLLVMEDLRRITARYAFHLEGVLPDGPDKTYILRKLRELAMWVHVAITRHADGAPRV